MPRPVPPPVPVPAILPALTGLRGVAAIWVVAYHLDLLSRATRPFMRGRPIPIADTGWLGVDLFFLLSGFVLMHAHAAKFATAPLQSVPRFLLGRACRVYPLNAVVTALVALLVATDPAFAAAFRAEWPGNLSTEALVRTLTLSTRWWGYAGGEWNEPVWSLSLELLGYLTFPAIAFGAMRLRSGGQALACALFCLALLFVLQVRSRTLGLNIINGHLPVARLFCEFIAGAALCRARMLGTALAAGFAPLLGSASASAILLMAWTHSMGVMPFYVAGLIWALSFGSSGPLDRLLGSDLASMLGRLSFPLYLLHAMPMRWWLSVVAQHGTDRPLAYAIAVAAGLAGIAFVAWQLHLWVERPCADLARRISRGSAEGRTRTAAPLGGTAVLPM